MSYAFAERWLNGDCMVYEEFHLNWSKIYDVSEKYIFVRYLRAKKKQLAITFGRKCHLYIDSEAVGTHIVRVPTYNVLVLSSEENCSYDRKRRFFPLKNYRRILETLKNSFEVTSLPRCILFSMRLQLLTRVFWE